MQQLINYINKYSKLDQEAIRFLKKYAGFEIFRKNQFILKPDQYCNKVWFIKSGMVRNYYLNDSNEITSWIHFEDELFTALDSYFGSVPTNEYYQACEDTELISLTKENSEKLEQFPQFSRFSNKLLEEQMTLIVTGTEKMKTMSAMEKYNYLYTVAPKLFKRAKQAHIASIMGITPETFSRIRKKQLFLDPHQE